MGRAVTSADEFRLFAYRAMEASGIATDPEEKARLAEIAFQASQLAERLGLSKTLTPEWRAFCSDLQRRIREETVFGSPAKLAILDGLLDEALAVMATDMGKIHLLDRDGKTLRVVTSRGLDPQLLSFFSSIDRDTDAASAFAVLTSARVIVDDVAVSPFHVGKPSGRVLREAGVRAVQSTPLARRNGPLHGVIATHWREPFAPSDEALLRLDRLVDQAVTEIEAIR